MASIPVGLPAPSSPVPFSPGWDTENAVSLASGLLPRVRRSDQTLGDGSQTAFHRRLLMVVTRRGTTGDWP